jgi:hypothetical protein
MVIEQKVCHGAFSRHTPVIMKKNIILQLIRLYAPMLPEMVTLLVVAGYSHLPLLRC